MKKLEELKEKFRETLGECMEEPAKALLIFVAATALVIKLIPSRTNHHLYLHIDMK